MATNGCLQALGSDSCSVTGPFTTSHQQHQQQAAKLHSDALHATADAGASLPNLGVFSAGAAVLDALHSLSGLPWWAVIPMTAVGIKTVLLPLSLKQAKIVRTNMVLWTEAYELQKQKHAKQQEEMAAAQPGQPLQQQQQMGAAAQQAELQDSSQLPNQPLPNHQGQQPHPVLQQGAADAAAAALQQLQYWQERIQLYHYFRRKCSVPHPAWLFVNSGLQVGGRAQPG